MKRTLIIWSCLILALTAGALWIIHNQQSTTQKITLAVVEETPAEKRARRFKKVSKVIVYSDEASMLNALEEKTADAGLTDFLTGLSMIKTGEYSNLKLAGSLMEPESAVVTFRKEDNAFRQAINEGIKKIIANGTYALISFNYFGFNILTKFELNGDPLPEIKKNDDSWLKIQHSGEISVAFYENNWPFSYFDDDNELAGFNVDIAKSVCRELGISFNPIVYPRDEILEGLINRYYDCIWCSIASAEPENSLLCFSNPFYISGLHFIVSKGSTIKNLD